MTRSRDTANLIAAGRRTGLAAYVAAISILALQLLTPLHLEQHDFSEVGETCAACAQLEQNGHGLVATPTTALAPQASVPALAATAVVIGARTQIGYIGRAPPLTA